MKKLFTSFLLLVVVVVVAAAVAAVMARKRLESMSDDEIRAYLASKLEGRVAEDQLATIQDAAISGIRRKTAGEAATEEPEPVDASTDDEPSADVADGDDDTVTINT